MRKFLLIAVVCVSTFFMENISAQNKVKWISFEQAVQSLLDQYNNDPSRPVAQLNIDPDTGQRTLLMNLDKQG